MTTNTGKHVVVAMSGGVDSTVVASMLVKQGFNVTGMMLKLWNEDGAENENRCCTPDAVYQARRFAAQLSIPFYVLDVKDEFYSNVVVPFINDYGKGNTPNPCIACNRLIRWGFLLGKAIDFGADYMATGHYARLEKNDQGGLSLLKGIDVTKDQSYVLSGLTNEQLSRTMLPLGGLTKKEVRAFARDNQILAADRPDSQDLCFLGRSNYRDFLTRHDPAITKPGDIVLTDGTTIGQHEGLAFYTIGQRKGIKISRSEALYVIEKDIENNVLVVGAASEMGFIECTVRSINWLVSSKQADQMEISVKPRYRSREYPAIFYKLSGDQGTIIFFEPVHDLTPGQLAAFYVEDQVVGSGIISGVVRTKQS